MWLTAFVIVFIIMVALILHDIARILKLQDELIKEQYIMRGELNAILDMASLGTSFLPKFSFPDGSGFPEGFPEPEKKHEETITVEIKPE
jgi:hypothetical protein